MSKQPVLETQRLILRPFQLSDAKETQRLAGHREIASTTLNIPHPYEDGMAEGWISTHKDAFDQGKGVTYAITAKDDGRLVGAISLMSIVNGHQAEMGYWVGVPYWGKGYCTEAGRALLEFGFSELGLNRIHACYLARNPSSGRVMEKIGMTYEGTRPQHVRKWDKFENLVLKGIIKEDWEKATSHRSR